MNFIKRIIGNEDKYNKDNENNSGFQDQVYKNNDKYRGDMKNGLRNGIGTYIFANGDRYEGQWKNNQKHGTGKYYYKTGELYIGKWANNKRNGLGKYFYLNGERYVGNWEDDRKHEQGTQFYPDGEWYRGQYYKGIKHGKGQYHKLNAIYEEVWEFGVQKENYKIKDVNLEDHDQQGEEEEFRVEKEVKQQEEEEKKQRQDSENENCEQKKERNEKKQHSPKQENHKNNEIDVPNLQSQEEQNIKTYADTNSYNNQSDNNNKPNLESVQEESEYKDNSRFQSRDHTQSHMPGNWDTYMKSFYQKNIESQMESINMETQLESMNMESGQYHSNASDTVEQITAIELITHESLQNKLATKWDTNDVLLHLEHLNLDDLKETFEENKIDGKSLLSLTSTDLKEMDITAVGQKKTFLNSIKSLKKIQKNLLTEQDIQKYNKFAKQFSKDEIIKMPTRSRRKQKSNSKINKSSQFLDSSSNNQFMGQISEEGSSSSTGEEGQNQQYSKDRKKSLTFQDELYDQNIENIQRQQSQTKKSTDFSNQSSRASSFADIDEDEQNISMPDSNSPRDFKPSISKQKTETQLPENQYKKKKISSSMSLSQIKDNEKEQHANNSDSYLEKQKKQNLNSIKKPISIQDLDQHSNNQTEDEKHGNGNLIQKNQQLITLSNKISSNSSLEKKKKLDNFLANKKLAFQPQAVNLQNIGKHQKPRQIDPRVYLSNNSSKEKQSYYQEDKSSSSKSQYQKVPSNKTYASQRQNQKNSSNNSQNSSQSPKNKDKFEKIYQKQRSMTKILSEDMKRKNQQQNISISELKSNLIQKKDQIINNLEFQTQVELKSEKSSQINNTSQIQEKQENENDNLISRFSIKPEEIEAEENQKEQQKVKFKNQLKRNQSTEQNNNKKFKHDNSEHESSDSDDNKQRRLTKRKTKLQAQNQMNSFSSTSSDESSSSSSIETYDKLELLKKNQSTQGLIAHKQQNSTLLSPMGKKQLTTQDDMKKETKHHHKKRKNMTQLTDEEILEKIKQFMDREKLSNFLIDSKELIWSSSDRIGTGGYGEVYKGSWLGQDVAVKQYGKRKIRFSQRRAFDFISEVQVINGLRHPNIVLYMGVCITPTHYLLINEYLEQGSLFDHFHIKKTQLDDDKILYIIEDIALGMTYLHGRGVLHCDLKTPNVLVDQNWNVKLCDFGLSRIRTNLNKKKKKKRKQGKIGTIQWMAPEIMREQEYTEKSDVYSFGMILWELLSRKIPYEKMSHIQIQGTVAYDDNYQHVYPQNGHPELIKIMKACLQREPKNRPDFKEIVNDIQLISKKGKLAHRKVIKDLVMFFAQ